MYRYEEQNKYFHITIEMDITSFPNSCDDRNITKGPLSQINKTKYIYAYNKCSLIIKRLAQVLGAIQQKFFL